MEETYDYFLREVDPIVGECITFLLCVRPNSVAATMLDFLEKRQRGEKPNIGTEKTEKATKAQRLYLATQISPVITKLVNRIATSRPVNVVEFMCKELHELVSQDESVTDTQAPQENLVSNSSPSVDKDAKAISEVKKDINIIIVGLDGAGKSSLVDAIQGKFNENIRPTIGFRPTTMMMGVDKVRFYDVGGGAKIRKIWPEYYHDVHAILYIVDSSQTDPLKIQEGIESFKDVINHPLLKDKPVVFVSNKQDLEGSKSSGIIKELYSLDSVRNCSYVELSCVRGGPESDYAGGADPRIETSLELLLSTVLKQFQQLNTRVQRDIEIKDAEEIKRRAEKERKILRSKIICAFPHKVDKAFLTPDLPTTPEDVLGKEDGETFLAAEIGVEKLPPIGVEVAALIGYQKLALQMVGSFICPISTKKKAMSWEECRDMIVELRLEVGLIDL